MNRKLLEAYDVGIKLVASLPSHLQNIKAIKNPEKYILVAKTSDEFYDFFQDTIAVSFIQDEINKNITVDILEVLGENETELKGLLFQQLKNQETKRYDKKAEKYLKDSFGTHEEIKRTIGGAYNNRTGYICLNPIFEDKHEIKGFDFYLWTLIHELGHAIHTEGFPTADSVLNKFLTLYWLTHLLPDRVFLKGLDASAAKSIIMKNIINNRRTDDSKSSEALKNVKFQNNIPAIHLRDMQKIMKIKQEDNIPTKYSDFSPAELWAESFALFTTANKDAKLLMPNMYGFICEEIIIEKGEVSV